MIINCRSRFCFREGKGSGTALKDAFSGYHPAVGFIYFALVLVFSMWFMHPAALVISLAGSFAWSVYLGGRKTLRFNLLAMLPMMLLTALINPAFNHEGETILAYFPGGNPLTLEAVLYGVAASAVLVTVLCWFSCYNRVMTSDKFVYLFGRLIPALSLVISMVLRFVPKFREQLKAVTGAQRCIGRDLSSGSIRRRARQGIRVLSILLTWALENAVETADSMRSRGYGLTGRTAFSIYRFDGRDGAALAWIGGLGAFILAMWRSGGFSCSYFPAIRLAPWGIWSVSGGLAYLLLCATPLIIDCWEDRKWKYLRSGT